MGDRWMKLLLGAVIFVATTIVGYIVLMLGIQILYASPSGYVADDKWQLAFFCGMPLILVAAFIASVYLVKRRYRPRQR